MLDLTFRDILTRSTLQECEMSSGSLGQGLSVAVGMALAAKMQGKRVPEAYCLCGDGEIAGGTDTGGSYVRRT